jgi:DNA repair exonuclease SbcCD nuclease subunit
MKFLWRTDLHLSDRSPQSRLDNWSDTLLAKLDQIRIIAEEEKVSAVIDGGDFFHIKSPNQTSHKLINRIIDVHKNYPCPVYSNVGNHDCIYGDISYLPQQPLGVLFESNVFHRLYDQYELRLPGIRVFGVPYHGTSYDLGRLKVSKEKDEVLIVIAHLLASPQGGSMFEAEDIVPYSFLDSCEADVFAFGHWHKNQGVVQLPSGKQVINIGSLSRGSLTQDVCISTVGAKARIPSVAIIDIADTITIKVIELKVSSPELTFNLEQKIKEEKRSLVIDNFISSMKSSLCCESSNSISSIIEDTEGLPQKVKELALLYLEKASNA